MKITLRFFAAFFSMLMSVSAVVAGTSCGGTTAGNSTVETPYYYNSDPTISGITVTAANMETFYMILDHTQAPHAKAVVTNTETMNGKGNPGLFGVSPNNIYAAINHDTLPHVPAISTGLVKYIEVDVLHTDQTSTTVGFTETNVTRGVVSTTLASNSYINRLGTYNGGTVVPLKDSGGNDLQILNMFDPNNGFGGQAFDLDRFRFAANKLWLKWKADVEGGTNNAATDWHTKFGYQPTGTMSYEQFIDNIVNDKPMFGIVRVVMPVGSGKALYSAQYRTNCVNGNEFTGANAATCQRAASDSLSYIYSSNQAQKGELSAAYTSDKCAAKKVEIYGMLLYDYVTQASYSPTSFADSNQYYTDNASPGSKNVADTSNFYLKVYESILVNQVNDHFKVSPATNTLVAGQDYRMDSLETARARMADGPGGSVPVLGDVPDAYKFEYLMRTGVSDALVSTPSADVLAYNFNTETLNAAARLEFATAWPSIKDYNRYHALFPSGYERGWMIAFDALDMTTADWAGLPTKASTTIGSANTSVTTYAPSWVTKSGAPPDKTDYAPFKVPTDTLDIDVYYSGASYYGNAVGQADSDPADNAVPNTYTKDWEDFPGLAFASGTLDIHAHANISGMLYTPDFGEMESKPEKNASFQYVNGAILIGDGIYFEDACDTGSNCSRSLIAVSYNPFAFDQLRTAPTLTIHKPTDIREIRGQ